MGKISNWLSKAIPGIGQYMAIAEPVLNVASQLGANKANRDIAQMNNQFNSIEAQKVRDYNTMMWNENNRYNDPSAQVQRLREAGLNPAFALGQVASGMVSSQPSSGNAASSSGNPQMQPFQLGGIYSQYQKLENEKLLTDAQVRNIDADTAGKVIDNSTKHLLNENTINKLISETESNKEQTKYQQISNRYGDELIQSQIARNNSQAASADAQARLNIADAVIRELEGVNMPAMIKLRLSEIASNIATNVSIQGLNKEKAKSEIENRLESAARQHGIRLDNDIKSRTADAIVAKQWIDNISGAVGTATGLSGNIMNWYKTYKKFTK